MYLCVCVCVGGGACVCEHGNQNILQGKAPAHTQFVHKRLKNSEGMMDKDFLRFELCDLDLVDRNKMLHRSIWAHMYEEQTIPVIMFIF